MKEKDKDLMERYIYEVVRRLPREQQNDITMELRELISDMMEQRCSEVGTCSKEEACTMERILEELGDPAEFAKRYRDENSCLIGPEYYDNYIWVLKIVLITNLAVVIFSSIIQGIFQNEMNLVLFGQWICDSLSDVIINMLGAFGAVTLIFVLLERKKVKVDLGSTRGKWKVKDLKDDVASSKIWTPLQLPPVPDKRALISRSDCVVSIVFIIIFCGVLALAPEFFGPFRFEDGQFAASVSIFNLEQWNYILPVFLGSLMIGLVDEIIRLVHGYYCKTVMYCSLICSTIQLILAVVLFKVMTIFNPYFREQFFAVFGDKFSQSAQTGLLWEPAVIGNVVLGIIFLITLLEVGTTVYKTLRYGVDRK